MRCLILDDESPARLELRQLLSAHMGVEVVAEAANVESALELTVSHRPEVVFVDVKLRGETGFDYIGRLQEPLPHFVFVTAFDQYAVRAFECNALDYLLKPVHPDRLAETIQRIRSRLPIKRRVAISQDAVFIKTGAVAHFIPWMEIHHIIAEGNYTRVFLNHSPSILVLRPLKEWLDLAPEGEFLQVHRRALVRLTAIKEMQNLGENRRNIVLDDGSTISVGRAYWPIIKRLRDG